jgi:hypothetical protein
MNHDSFVLSRRLLHSANRELSRIDFLRQVSKVIIELAGCDEMELRLNEGNLSFGWKFRLHPREISAFEILPGVQNPDGKTIPCSHADALLERLCRDVLSGRADPASHSFTKHGSFWTGNNEMPSDFYPATDNTGSAVLGGDYRSIALIPFAINDGNVGLLHLKSRQRQFFTPAQIELYEGFAQTLGMAVAVRQAQFGLRERIKELTCLYGITEIVSRPETALEEILQCIVMLLPPALQHPEMAVARINLDKRSYTTTNFRESPLSLCAEVVVGGELRGNVEVAYLQEGATVERGWFLDEEQNLIDAVASQVALIVKRKETESDRAKLQHQLQHADRLATIGQLAAGVAHELNEPLANILGFAQLAKKSPGLPAQTKQDIGKIVSSSLHAREVIKKLLTFARQMPPTKTRVNLNKIVDDGLYFLESRCAKLGIQLVRELAPELPEITADATQLQQVLVNLVVNAIQAMPQGGRLLVRTLAGTSHILLVVEDTGAGMTEEVKGNLFTPFFTTKDVGQGTGLGLAVVHGIARRNDQRRKQHRPRYAF